MKTAITILAMVCLISVGAQVSIERQVISAFGQSGSGSILLSSTAGQPEYTTAEGTSHFLTQGFHQPLIIPLEVQLEILPGQCNEGATIFITQVSGCAENVEVYVDGIQQELPISSVQPGTYVLEFIGGPGCQQTQEVVITEPVQTGCDLVFYNAITPNGDGSNDFWAIENLETLQDVAVSVQIVNRWGMLSWSSLNYGNDSRAWVGNSTAGDPLPDATYYYTVQIGDNTFEGYIELVR